MSAGRKPPITPPRNWLASGRIIGKRPPLPRFAAVAKMREAQRLQKRDRPFVAVLTLSGGDQGQVLPHDPREAARTALTGADPRTERSRRKIEKLIRAAKKRAADQVPPSTDAAACATAAHDMPPPRSTKPTTPQPGRYGELKDRQGGAAPEP
jgi:hypothetical protein